MEVSVEVNTEDNEVTGGNMDKYIPPYTISEKMLQLVSNISELVGALDNYKVLETKPHLRKNNRIRSIHSSLKIEANSLSLDEVRDVIAGQTVTGPPTEIREVKNAYAAYEKLQEIDPTSIKDLLSVHKIMTNGIVAESGAFRKGEEGVFSGDECIFVAPPPHLVKGLIQNLLRWVKRSDGVVHPLIIAAVFHYELVFIHPFSDGNGRMARLWHTVLLYRWRNVFAYIPLESQIEKFQQTYYEKIAQCNRAGNADAFIEFMLEMIKRTLQEMMIQVKESDVNASKYVKNLLEMMAPGIPYTATSILKLLGLKSRETLRRNYIHPAIQGGFIRMTIPEKPNSRNQQYIKNAGT